MQYSSRESDLKRRCVFATSPLYEVFYALNVLCDRHSRIHHTWVERARRGLPPEFYDVFESIGGDPFLWTVLPDVIGIVPVDSRFEEIVSSLQGVPQQDFVWSILDGIFHIKDTVDKLAAREITLEQGVSTIPAQKQEWLAYIGLFPFDANRPTARMLQVLLDSPDKFISSVTALISIFWRGVFEDTWKRMVPYMVRSIGEKERLFEVCSLQEFATQSLLRIEVDEEKGLLKAIRGGYTAPFKRIEQLNFLPSAFNDKRLWSALEKSDGSVVAYLPYFEPTISLEQMAGDLPGTIIEPETDPALIFKALGDTTRYALVKLIANSEFSSADLAKKLGVSRATITHHVYLLREAGLVTERAYKGATLLRLRRETIENLSPLVISSLFEDPGMGN